MKSIVNKSYSNKLKNLLLENKLVKIGEILILFILALTFINLVLPKIEDNPILKQILLWFTNIIMLIYVWIGIKIRGESWSDIGLSCKSIDLKGIIKSFLLSLLVFLFALIGFVLGSIIMAKITGIPESANLSGYDYLKDNIGMLFLTLIGVYIVSSIGEEVIYRGFLIKRISEIGASSKNTTTIAVLISSIIFGLVHYQWGPIGIVQTALMGLALGICYIKLKKKLWILILAHGYLDTILIVQMYLASN